MSEQTPVPVDPRKAVILQTLGERLGPEYDAFRRSRIAHELMLGLSRQGYRIVAEAELTAATDLDTEMRYADLLSDAHATICLLLEKAGGEVEVAQADLIAARARRYSMVTVTKPAEGTVVLAQYNVRATGHVAKLRKDLGLDQ